jgi:two-component system sensor histidine kinase AlgZ
MRASINQKPFPLRLPELRNLGTVLRIVLVVNGLALLAVLVREPQLARLAPAWLEMAAVRTAFAPDPVALPAAPWLERLPYRFAAPSIVALAVAVTIGLDGLLATLGMDVGRRGCSGTPFALPPSSPLLFYFHLRAKALSPAISEARLQALQARIRCTLLFNSINAVLSRCGASRAARKRALEDQPDLFRVL